MKQKLIHRKEDIKAMFRYLLSGCSDLRFLAEPMLWFCKSDSFKTLQIAKDNATCLAPYWLFQVKISGKQFRVWYSEENGQLRFKPASDTSEFEHQAKPVKTDMVSDTPNIKWHFGYDEKGAFVETIFKSFVPTKQNALAFLKQNYFGWEGLTAELRAIKGNHIYWFVLVTENVSIKKLHSDTSFRKAQENHFEGAIDKFLDNRLRDRSCWTKFCKLIVIEPAGYILDPPFYDIFDNDRARYLAATYKIPFPHDSYGFSFADRQPWIRVDSDNSAKSYFLFDPWVSTTGHGPLICAAWREEKLIPIPFGQAQFLPELETQDSAHFLRNIPRIM